MKKWLIFLIIFTAGCVHRNAVEEYPKEPALLERAQDFYVFLLKREIGIWHNDQDKEMQKYFLDRESYYDFMDSLLYILRDRNINRNTITQYYIEDIEVAEDGASADVKVKFLSRDAFLLYRKIDATQHWQKTYDKWYPKKIEAPYLNWYKKYTERYALPPMR